MKRKKSKASNGRDEASLKKWDEWKKWVNESAHAGNIVQHDDTSPFDDLHYHNTILHLVILGFYSDPDPAKVVDLLLEHGADPNIQNDLGETPLHIVCQVSIQNPDIARLLLSHGADPDIRTKKGKRPADYLGLSRSECKEIRKMLEESSRQGK